MKLIKKAVGALLATTMIATSVVSVSAVETTQQKTTTLPSSYSSVEQGYVTPVNHQGDTNMCCSYASIAACESSMIINNGYDTSLDLSELHSHSVLLSKPVDELGLFDGGLKRNLSVTLTGSHVNDVLINLVNNQGVVTETANHGQFSSSKINQSFKIYDTKSRYAYSEAYVENAYKSYTTNPELVKELIMKYGAGATEIRCDEFFANEETGAFYCYDKSNNTPIHGVAIVGWDDNFPKEYCTVNGYTPENDGAWIIKNSYGTEEGIDGYNWVSYEDLSIGKHPVVFYDLSTKEQYANIYQYDDVCVNGIYEDSSFTGGAYMSNMFTAMKENETLEAVSFYTADQNLDYTVEVYTGVDGSPTNGTLKASVSGEDLIMGYHTVYLPQAVALNKGEKFSVVVNIKDNQNPEREVSVSVDGRGVNMDFVKNLGNGESFVSANGEEWNDAYDLHIGNVRVKAFTNSDEEAELDDYYDSYNGKTREELHAELNECIDGFYTDLESGYKYRLSNAINYFMDYLDYYQQACNNPENFSAIELDGIIKDYDFYFDNFISSCDIVDKINYYDSAPQWQEFKSVYDEVLDKIMTNEAQDEDYTTFTEAYNSYIADVVNNGAYDSYLQNFGDANNDGDINITDATLIQELVSNLTDYDFTKFYNSDVDGDGEVNIKDATTVQMHVSKYIDYMPVFDKQIGDEVVNSNIDLETAVKNLNTAIENVKNDSMFDVLNYMPDTKAKVLLCQYSDALEVSYSPENYHPNVIDFKARCLNNSLEKVQYKPN